MVKLLAGLLVLFSFQSWSSQLTYTDVVNLIDNHHVTSLESLLPLLPEDFRSGYTLVYETRSLQGASSAKPRVIMFGGNATLTCAFNGDSALQGFDTLECFQFDKTQRLFDYRQIQFPNANNGLSAVAFSQTNRSADGRISCTSCHSADPRPNWDSYSNWKGIYGSVDDRLEGIGDDTEKNHYATFTALRDTHPRYKWLIQGNQDISPYVEDDTLPFMGRPNLALSDLCDQMNGMRAARILESRTLPWQSLGWAMKAFSCPVSVDQQKSLANAGLNYPDDVDLNKIFESLKLSNSDWSTQISGDTPTTTKDYEHQGGNTYLSETLAISILNERALAGDSMLQKALAQFAPTQPGTFYAALGTILPYMDHFESLSTDAAYVCPRIADLFVDAYLESKK